MKNIHIKFLFLSALLSSNFCYAAAPSLAADGEQDLKVGDGIPTTTYDPSQSCELKVAHPRFDEQSDYVHPYAWLQSSPEHLARVKTILGNLRWSPQSIKEETVMTRFGSDPINLISGYYGLQQEYAFHHYTLGKKAKGELREDFNSRQRIYAIGTLMGNTLHDIAEIDMKKFQLDSDNYLNDNFQVLQDNIHDRFVLIGRGHQDRDHFPSTLMQIIQGTKDGYKTVRHINLIRSDFTDKSEFYFIHDSTALRLKKADNFQHWNQIIPIPSDDNQAPVSVPSASVAAPTTAATTSSSAAAPVPAATTSSSGM